MAPFEGINLAQVNSKEFHEERLGRLAEMRSSFFNRRDQRRKKRNYMTSRYSQPKRPNRRRRSYPRIESPKPIDQDMKESMAAKKAMTVKAFTSGDILGSLESPTGSLTAHQQYWKQKEEERQKEQEERQKFLEMEKLKLEQAREKALNLLRSIEIESDPLETSMQDVAEALSDIKELKDDDEDDSSSSRI